MCARSAPSSFEIVAKGFSLHYFRSHPWSLWFSGQSLCTYRSVCSTAKCKNAGKCKNAKCNNLLTYTGAVKGKCKMEVHMYFFGITDT